MEQKHKNPYNSLSSYAQEVHERNKKRIKASGIAIVILPVILGFIRWFTDSDKIVFLIIWILCMFAISAFLVSIEYLDHAIRTRAEETADDAEEGGDE